ncbi:DarT ssDNA thymidine ADP-ribosyltransferase family protein [Providencia hangzhouensis]|uniref:DarT ssDNA thymidine ADP-ribosyltransferase family protein n=1 Tax=Providencia hangzhouensis TaxID=3031799 RepID=A0ABY9Z5L5_9GAMM|nr:DarT ssDNA thymidine ADP-ribosyltransferase family protein [Providencia hangzhouensis]WNK22483.1 DarT ssDNA thymidine ADP-ribosyltransferase family protein [Providencia hangzhouensis]
MTLQKIVQERNITKLFHFTHSDNLSSIIQRGLKSKKELDDEKIAHNHNDDKRLDGHTNAICLSISYPNAKMFYKYRQEKQGDWILLEISPTILWDKDCAFYPTNAASNNVRMNKVSLMQGVSAFNAMFEDSIFAIERCSTLPTEFTTDVQAEVLVFDRIEASYIQKVIHPNEASATRFRCLDTTLQHDHCDPNTKTFYSQRDYFLG